MSTLYRAKYVLPMTDAGVIENGEVLVEDGRIQQVGQGIAASCPGVCVRDLGAVVLMPGFVNAHSHVEYTLSRNTYDGLSFWDWIESVGFRRDKTPSREVMLASARLGVELCASSGITCLGDCSYSGIAAEAMDMTGVRGIVYKELFGQSMGDDYAARFATVLDQISELQSRVSERIRVGLSPHTVYTTGADVLRLCANTCAELGVPVALHLAETRAEEDYTTSGTGPIADLRRRQGYEPMVSGVRSTQVLERAGLLRPGVSLAHCVQLPGEDIEMIRASGAGVVHCPRSNAYLGSGIFPMTAFREAGVSLGLGTDSAASCLTLDFFEEMRFALALHRAQTEDAGALLAKDVLEMATAGGAAALGIADVGRLEPGMRADMIAVDVSDMLPGEDIHLAVLSRTPSDVRLVVVDGVSVDMDVEARTRELRELMERSDIA